MVVHEYIQIILTDSNEEEKEKEEDNRIDNDDSVDDEEDEKEIELKESKELSQNGLKADENAIRIATIDKLATSNEPITAILSSQKEMLHSKEIKGKITDKDNHHDEDDKKVMQIMQNQQTTIEKPEKEDNEKTDKNRVRLMSAGIQTSPTIWFGIKRTVNLKQSNSIEWEPHPIYSDPFSPSQVNNNRTERRYFIYIVSEGNPFYRKNCIGKITLPAGSLITLSELRDYLMKTDDNQLKEILKRDKSFRFLTETYRFVAQNEAVVSIDQVYPTQGIFIKLNALDLPLNPIGRSRRSNLLSKRK